MQLGEQKRRISLGKTATVAMCLLCTPGLWAAQTVYLYFDAPSTVPAGETHVYTTAERDAIKAILEEIFAGFPITFTLTAPPVFTASTISFNQGFMGGAADQIDFRNLEKTDDAKINAIGLLAAWEASGLTHPDGRPIELDPLTGEYPVDMIVDATANLVAHEFGHLLGLRHHDAFGPVGTGIATLGSKYTPAYTGPDSTTGGAPTTGLHVMALSSSISLSPGSLLTPSWLGERSALKLAFNELPSGDVVVPETAAVHDTVPTAQLVGLASFPVPNFAMPPDPLAGAIVTGEAVVVTASLDAITDPAGEISTEIDYYKFVGLAGDRVTIEVISDIISTANGGRLSDPVDPSVYLLFGETSASFGAVLPYELGSAFNDDQFESSPDPTDGDPIYGDAILFDVLLPEDGEYVIEVGFDVPSDLDPATFGPEQSGDYELFVYRTVVVPPPPCPGDVNFDGVVDLSDLATVLAAFGTTGPAGSLTGDANDDGVVNLSDLAIVLAAFGVVCG